MAQLSDTTSTAMIDFRECDDVASAIRLLQTGAAAPVELHLNGSHLSDSDIAALLTAAQDSGHCVAAIWATGSGAGEQSSVVVAEMLTASNVLAVGSVSETALPPNPCSRSRLTHLQLAECRAVSPTAALCLARALPASNLRVLDLSGCPVGDDGAIAIALALAAYSIPRARTPLVRSGCAPALEELRLARCGIGASGARALAGALSAGRNTALRTLLLDDNAGIGDSGVLDLACACSSRLCGRGADGGRRGELGAAAGVGEPGSRPPPPLDLSISLLRCGTDALASLTLAALFRAHAGAFGPGFAGAGADTPRLHVALSLRQGEHEQATAAALLLVAAAWVAAGMPVHGTVAGEAPVTSADETIRKPRDSILPSSVVMSAAFPAPAHPPALPYMDASQSRESLATRTRIQSAVASLDDVLRMTSRQRPAELPPPASECPPHSHGLEADARDDMVHASRCKLPRALELALRQACEWAMGAGERRGGVELSAHTLEEVAAAAGLCASEVSAQHSVAARATLVVDPAAEQAAWEIDSSMLREACTAVARLARRLCDPDAFAHLQHMPSVSRRVLQREADLGRALAAHDGLSAAAGSGFRPRVPTLRPAPAPLGGGSCDKCGHLSASPPPLDSSATEGRPATATPGGRWDRIVSAARSFRPTGACAGADTALPSAASFATATRVGSRSAPVIIVGGQPPLRDPIVIPLERQARRRRSPDPASRRSPEPPQRQRATAVRGREDVLQQARSVLPHLEHATVSFFQGRSRRFGALQGTPAGPLTRDPQAPRPLLLSGAALYPSVPHVLAVLSPLGKPVRALPLQQQQQRSSSLTRAGRQSRPAGHAGARSSSMPSKAEQRPATTLHPPVRSSAALNPRPRLLSGVSLVVRPEVARGLPPTAFERIGRLAARSRSPPRQPAASRATLAEPSHARRSTGDTTSSAAQPPAGPSRSLAPANGDSWTSAAGLLHVAELTAAHVLAPPGLWHGDPSVPAAVPIPMPTYVAAAAPAATAPAGQGKSSDLELPRELSVRLTPQQFAVLHTVTSALTGGPGPLQWASDRAAREQPDALRPRGQRNEGTESGLLPFGGGPPPWTSAPPTDGFHVSALLLPRNRLVPVPEEGPNDSEPSSRRDSLGGGEASAPGGSVDTHVAPAPGTAAPLPQASDAGSNAMTTVGSPTGAPAALACTSQAAIMTAPAGAAAAPAADVSSPPAYAGSVTMSPHPVAGAQVAPSCGVSGRQFTEDASGTVGSPAASTIDTGRRTTTLEPQAPLVLSTGLQAPQQVQEVHESAQDRIHAFLARFNTGKGKSNAVGDSRRITTGAEDDGIPRGSDSPRIHGGMRFVAGSAPVNASIRSSNDAAGPPVATAADSDLLEEPTVRHTLPVPSTPPSSIEPNSTASGAALGGETTHEAPSATRNTQNRARQAETHGVRADVSTAACPPTLRELLGQLQQRGAPSSTSAVPADGLHTALGAPVAQVPLAKHAARQPAAPSLPALETSGGPIAYPPPLQSSLRSSSAVATAWTVLQSILHGTKIPPSGVDAEEPYSAGAAPVARGETVAGKLALPVVQRTVAGADVPDSRLGGAHDGGAGSRAAAMSPSRVAAPWSSDMHTRGVTPLGASHQARSPLQAGLGYSRPSESHQPQPRANGPPNPASGVTKPAEPLPRVRRSSRTTGAGLQLGRSSPEPLADARAEITSAPSAVAGTAPRVDSGAQVAAATSAFGMVALAALPPRVAAAPPVAPSISTSLRSSLLQLQSDINGAVQRVQATAERIHQAGPPRLAETSLAVIGVASSVATYESASRGSVGGAGLSSTAWHDSAARLGAAGLASQPARMQASRSAAPTRHVAAAHIPAQ